MKELIFYNTNVVTHASNANLPGVSEFKKFFGIYPQSSVFIDRSETITIPVKVRSLYPIPKLRALTNTYEDICNERALELLSRARTMDVPIYVAWSGGIDSTLILVTLLTHASDADKKRITVLLSEESIAEYPAFYQEHIRGSLACESMSLFPYLLGTRALIIGGENNDQVFGSDVISKLINHQGPAIIHERYRREIFFSFFNSTLANEAATGFCLDVIERVAASAPVSLMTHFDYLWWLNFAVKWQFVATRMLPYVAPSNVANVREGYLGVLFDQFYNTEKFQLWSMNNMDLKIKDSWSTYKWPAKDVIYKFTRDEDYRQNKQKRGSLGAMLQQQRSYNFIDSSFNFYRTLDSSEYFEPNNDFLPARHQA